MKKAMLFLLTAVLTLSLTACTPEAKTDGSTTQTTVIPSPDSMLRVFMAWKPLDAPIEIKPQELPAFARNGFTVVEWGGAKIE